ncbi:2'-5' RNA ligase family protein [Microbacterium oryzae]|uniref:2'-5' RNA ligase family protein n=1 Tax=Microbacterium oryzae TaxID=743009 RepID=UPI0025B0723B|nr:2'-5' RNA ligase family protein [Microbacterium oryzae]MDN3311753.1 2'-5' RNA ligase family protein [Microbacterium oryzae]
MSRTALIVKAPTSDKLVALRRQFAADARFGVPPHITVLFPFVPLPHLDEAAMTALRRAVCSVRRFNFALTDTDWFGRDVLWLAPGDASPFVRLTAAVHHAFPVYPPYGGLYDGSEPHATIGDTATHADLIDAEREVRTLLPLHGRATAVTLLVEDANGVWGESAEIPLGHE